MPHPKKPARISPESRPVAYGAATLAVLIYAGAFAASYHGLMDLAQHMLIPRQLHYVVPAVVDLALVLFTLATLLRRHRGESTVVTNLAAAFWVAVSIAGNVFHVLIPAGALETWTVSTYAGASLAALMPIAALGASLVLENVLIARPDGEPVAESAAFPKAAPVKAVAPAVAARTPVKESVKVAADARPAMAAAQASRPAVAAARPSASQTTGGGVSRPKLQHWTGRTSTRKNRPAWSTA
ncbi:hypothetical protein ASH00_14680 [Arthrobacter sp. Soil782]|uniref:DUF2637 domain-containing protein n=1 Tax=Arthrobacter sp. Soil782 TaxID=1736410 RepID=UPI0006F688CF|nr:DUF2637 domain-containing protein [Arthrobacter sp. Soil782]KRF04346.1 hypothetical protein ASH00_14680 [Arthrobacter sp. Soil782]